MCMEITYLKTVLHLPVANELNALAQFVDPVFLTAYYVN